MKRMLQSEIAEFIRARVAELLDVEAANVAMDRDLDSYGFNSVAVVSLIGELEDWLDLELSPTVVFEYPTIDAAAGYLHSELVAGGPFDADHEAA